MKKTRIFHAGLEWFILLLVLSYVFFGTRYGHFLYRIVLLCSYRIKHANKVYCGPKVKRIVIKLLAKG